MADQPPVMSSTIRAEIAGNRLEVIESGDARLKLLLELIGGAERSIKILMYMFNADPVGEQVRDALVDAAARGVEIKLLIDGFGSDAGVGLLCRSQPGRRRRMRFQPALWPPLPSAKPPEAGGDRRPNRDHRRREHRRHVYERSRAGALARPVAAARWARGGEAGPLLRYLVPLGDAAQAEPQLRPPPARRI